MKIYTKTGDAGKTSLFGGERVYKDNIRVEAYGAVDELNATLGVALSENILEKSAFILEKIQNDLFVLGGDLATPFDFSRNLELPRTKKEMTEFLEEQIDELESKTPPLKSFILPGGSKAAALLHLARTVCRRAERIVTRLKKKEKINENILIYLNRLSDLLFVLARYENHYTQTPEKKWVK